MYFSCLMLVIAKINPLFSCVDGSKGAKECQDSLRPTGPVQDAIWLGCKV